MRVLSEASVAEMLSNQMGDIVVETPFSTNPALALDSPFGAGADAWGLGFQLTASNTASGLPGW